MAAKRKKDNAEAQRMWRFAESRGTQPEHTLRAWGTRRHDDAILGAMMGALVHSGPMEEIEHLCE